METFSGNTYTYDALGRVTEVVFASGHCARYAYDPFGRRVSKTVLDTSSPAYAMADVLENDQYHYDGSAVAVEYRPFMPSKLWTYYGGVMRVDGAGNQQWYYRDGQGSVSAVTDNSGNVLEAYEYNAQGQVQITNGSGTVLTGTGIGNDLMYAGYRYDAETGNYFCNARYYNPTLGRFISRDPLGGAEFSQGTNLYAYCGNDGVNETDPSGEGRWEWVQTGSTAAAGYMAWDPAPSATQSATISSTGPNRLGPVVFSPGFTSRSMRPARSMQILLGIGHLGEAVTLARLGLPLASKAPGSLKAITMAAVAIPAAASFVYGMANIGAGISSDTSFNNTVATLVYNGGLGPPEFMGPECFSGLDQQMGPQNFNQ